MIERKEYPRPQLRRDEWISLNGLWQFEFDDKDDGVKRDLHLGKVDLKLNINVPFCYQYPASGINQKEYHKTLWYRKDLILSKSQLKKRVLLCFNGCDYIADIWVNGKHAITHQGAYTAFTCDVTEYLKEKNVIVVRCIDPLDPTIPRGKQSWTNEKFGCWYVPNSGIWQSVWIEFFEEDCLDSYTLITDIDNYSINGMLTTLRGIADSAKFNISYKGKLIRRQCIDLDGKYNPYSISLKEKSIVEEYPYWTPETPNLFYIDIELFKGDKCVDVVHARFGMRKIHIDCNGIICLNNAPLYQRLILDQGYFEKSGITPPSCESLKRDIELSKAMGFNGARKHQKIEDPYFYYYAEELGFLTWCEMPSAYNYNQVEQQLLMQEWQQIVKDNSNFTSIICYVPLNESWGVDKLHHNKSQQAFAQAMYYATKAMDEGKLVSTNDGWENIEATDIISIHDYSFSGEKFKEMYKKEKLALLYPQPRKLLVENVQYNGQPILLTEFGGIAMKSEIGGENWGYNSGAADCNEFYERYQNLMFYLTTTYFQGFCYTQLTDVQQEVNGLLDANHNPKFDVEKIKEYTTMPHDNLN